jgi:hypothetical protein
LPRGAQTSLNIGGFCAACDDAQFDNNNEHIDIATQTSISDHLFPRAAALARAGPIRDDAAMCGGGCLA